MNVPKKKSVGFSLVEILVVVSIIGILAASSVLGFAKQQTKARESRRLTDVSTVGIAIESYQLIHNNLPYQVSATQQDGPLDGTKISESYGIQQLVIEGLVNNLPTEPKPVSPKPGSGGSNAVFCTDYTYAYSWYAHNYWYGFDDNKDGSIQTDEKFTLRNYALYFRSEIPGTYHHHPIESTVYITNQGSWCKEDNSGGYYSILLGPAS